MKKTLSLRHHDLSASLRRVIKKKRKGSIGKLNILGATKRCGAREWPATPSLPPRRPVPPSISTYLQTRRHFPQTSQVGPVLFFRCFS